MIRGYPARNAGFRPVPERPAPVRPPIPANDNIPGGPQWRSPLPTPANDNARRALRRSFRRAVFRRLTAPVDYYAYARNAYNWARVEGVLGEMPEDVLVSAPGYRKDKDCGRVPNYRGPGLFPNCSGSFIVDSRAPGAAPINESNPTYTFPNRPSTFTLWYSLGWAGNPYASYQHRMLGSQFWTRTSTSGAVPVLTYVPAQAPRYAPAVDPGPWADPFFNPIRWPVVTPRPIPHWAVPHRRADRNAVERTVFGYVSPTQTGTSPRPNNPPLPRPPGRGVRELKAYWRSGLRFLNTFVGPVTEGVDHFNAVYRSVPSAARRRWEYEFWRRNGRWPRLDEKAVWLWRNWRLVRVDAAVANLARNQLQDYLIGRLSRGANQFSARYSWGPGISVGPAL